MKKLLLVMAAVVALMTFGAGSVAAFSLGGYQGDVTFSMEDLYAWGRLYNYVGPTPNGTYTALNSNPFYGDVPPGYVLNEATRWQAGNVVEDTWAIARVEKIKNNDGTMTLWDSSIASTELTVLVWGFQDDMLVQNSQNATDVYQIGGRVQMYEDSAKNFTNGGVVARTGVNAYTTVTDGTLVLDFVGNAGRTYTDKNGQVGNYTSYVNFDFSSTTGSGNMLLDTTGSGTQDWMFNTDTRQFGADFKVDYSGNAYTGTLGWTVHDGPTGYANVVPEPATMLLFGSGLIGLAGWGRRKFGKKN